MSCLSPYGGDVGVLLDDLLEGRKVDARQAADLVDAVPAGEEPADVRRRSHPGRLRAAAENVRAARVAHNHWEPVEKTKLL